MKKPIRVFISSVQKELELERASVAALIATDPFLLHLCVPVLFEREPPPPRPGKQPYLEAQLTERQRNMLARTVRGEEITSRGCQAHYKVFAQALHRDFQKLVNLGLAAAVGSGRAARYRVAPPQ